MANLIPRDFAGGEELLGKLMNSFWQERQMNTDIKEYEDKYLVQADLPGIKKENIRVSYVNNTLTISAAQTETTETEEDFGHYLRKERSSSAYQRTFTITDIDDESIKAVFEDGVLTLTLPKPATKMHPQKYPDRITEIQKAVPSENALGNCLSYLRACRRYACLEVCGSSSEISF